MRLPIYQVDAFTSRLFAGNPAAVVPLQDWPPDATLQAVAAENNLSETAFVVRDREAWELRWFTPAAEVDLCGHATLAAAAVIFRHVEPERRRLEFRTRKAGTLVVTRHGEELALDFPARPPAPVAVPAGLEAALGAAPMEVLAGARDYLCVFENTEDVHNLRPDFAVLAKLGRPVICTAPGVGEFDYSRPGEVVRCPWHGWEYDIRTGQSWFDPRRVLVRRYDVSVKPGSEVLDLDGLQKGPYVAETYTVTVEQQYVLVEIGR